MRPVALAVPGRLDTPTGGYAYARRLLEHLPACGVAIRPLALPAAYPDPAEADLAETLRLVARTPPETVLLIDGLAFGAMPAALVEGFRRPVAALVHHPLGLEAGLAPDRQAALIASEAAALARAERVIVTSPLTGRLLVAEFGVDPLLVTVAEPGTDPAGRARGTGAPVALLAVGAVSPRKGYDVLVEALADLADLPWRLTVAGALDRDPDNAARLAAAIRRHGLAERIALAGEVGEAALAELYDRADLFVSPSLFEGYGMVLAEALARGLPIVASTGGAAAETVPDSAALKVEPGDAAALGRALRQAIESRDLRAALGDAAWAAGRGLPRWPETARKVAAALREVGR